MDIWHHIGLSGEPLQDHIQRTYGTAAGSLGAPKTADKIWEINLRLREYQKEYMEYWNGTARQTKSGKPVDAILTPVAPFAALQFGNTFHIGRSSHLSNCTLRVQGTDMHRIHSMGQYTRLYIRCVPCHPSGQDA